jgi:hypothetical protein
MRAPDADSQCGQPNAKDAKPGRKSRKYLQAGFFRVFRAGFADFAFGCPHSRRAYNHAMFRRIALSLVLPLAAAAALAQQPAEPARAGRPDQRIERITHEDAGSRIDELRVGGQTQSITVQPKAAVPAYEIDPGNTARSRAGGDRNGLSSVGGQRYWNALRF